MSRTRVKVCGVRDAEMARVAAEAGADAVGLVFVPGTPRAIEPEAAFAVMSALPPLVTAVGVFRDLTLDQFVEVEQACPTPLVQIHGPAEVDLVRRCGPGVVRAIHGPPEAMARELETWADIEEVDAVLLDGSAGGEGAPLDWATGAKLVEGYSKPIIVAGGLDATNVAEAITAMRPYAVDVSSGVESSPGVKDAAKVRSFCEAVRRADA